MKPDYQHSRIFVALPALAEMSYLPEFIKCVKAQTFKNYELIICINQPESWWSDKEHLAECKNNQESINWLKTLENLDLTIIDKSSKGKAWLEKKTGVGWARKVIMDYIKDKAGDSDIILSLDADTTFEANYFQSILDNFRKNPKQVAISIPYYHLLTQDENTNRHILRYEIYMRYYALNLLRINNIYNFSALGSAIAVPVWVYKRVGGITPHKSGEDFYFLLKLRKFGQIGLWNSKKVYPAARYSNRVLFGTGPAMIKGAVGDWTSYPIYDYKYFNELKKTYESFGKLYLEDLNFPMKNFLADLFKDEKWYYPLRKNSKTEDQFVNACQHKVDALRILQYLKTVNKEDDQRDEEKLSRFIQKFYHEQYEITIDLNSPWKYDKCSVSSLNSLRDFLMKKEEEYQKSSYAK